MAVLNPPSSLPGLVRALTNHLLVSRAEYDEERLKALFAPVGLGGDEHGSRGVDNTLEVARHIGLLETVDGGQIVPSQRVQEGSACKPYTAPRFRRMIRDLILDLDRDGDPWSGNAESRTGGGRDLARGLSWFLAQDASGPPLKWTSHDDRPSVESLQSQQLRDLHREERAFVNDTRWQAFARWAPFLGLAEHAYISNVGPGLIPLPVLAIRDAISEIEEHELTVAALLAQVTRKLPVVSGGAARTTLDQILTDDPDPLVRRHALDSSISQSLLLLEEEALLQLLRRSDAESRLILDHDQERHVSHVVIAAATRSDT